MAKLDKLAKIMIGRGVFPLETYAQIEAVLGHIDGAVPEPTLRSGGDIETVSAEYLDGKIPLVEFLKRPGAFIGEDGARYRNVPHRATFLGKGARDVFGTDEDVSKKCRAYEEKYRKLVERYRAEAS